MISLSFFKRPFLEIKLRSVPEKTLLDQKRVALAFTRCFSSDEGEIVLAYLRKTVFETALHSDAHENAYKFQEGQRQLLVSMLRWVERGKSS